MGSRQAQLAIGGGLVAITTAYFLLRYLLQIYRIHKLKNFIPNVDTDGRRDIAFVVPENVASCRHLQRTNTEMSTEILHGHSPNFHVHVSVSVIYNIPTIDLPILLQENMWTDPGTI
jgi:hypothetical protein